MDQEKFDDERKNVKRHPKKKRARSTLSKLLNESLHGQILASPASTFESRRNPGRVLANHTTDRGNPKSLYVKYVDITPAKNINRPMEPIFNTGFSKNGTNGVPKFVELDVEWTGFANTFMMDQVSYQAIQQVRKAMKSNLFYSDEDIKKCLTNAIALTVFGKQLERDVHWNLYNGSSDFNFAQMFRYRNQVVGTYGIVPLYPVDYLLDENLPLTSAIYDKIVSLFNQVVCLPSRISEFISHYFGSLFTLEKDGFNDQYLKINMHDIDWFAEDGSLSHLDLAQVSLDDYITLLNAYSKKYAVIISDLKKCLGVVNLQLCRYDVYSYAFVFDKTLLQALINGYTSNSMVENGYVRMDQIPGVSDDLTQYLFLGGIQPEDNSLSEVKAIRILDMVLKCNSDDNIKWPKSLDQLPVIDVNDSFITKDEPFGLAITTDYIVDTTVSVTASSSGETLIVPVPVHPEKAPVQTARTKIQFDLGASPYTKFPANFTKVYYDTNANPNDIGVVALTLLTVALEEVTAGIYKATFYYAYAGATIEAIPIDAAPFEFQGEFEFVVSGPLATIKIVANEIQNKSSPSTYFCNVLMSDVAGSIMNHLRSKYTFLSAVTLVFYNNYPMATHPDDTRICVMMARYSTYVSVQIQAFRNGGGNLLTWTVNDTAIQRFSLLPDLAPAPSGLMAFRNMYLHATITNNSLSISAVDGSESLPMYVSQVVDYHIPIAYQKRTQIAALWPDADVAVELGESTQRTLIKEDYIPYYYNILDLIPVLYEMFVSLFSIDAIKK